MEDFEIFEDIIDISDEEYELLLAKEYGHGVTLGDLYPELFSQLKKLAEEKKEA